MKKIIVCLVLLIAYQSSIIGQPSEDVKLLPDIDVTFISRTPRYERLRVSYHQRSDGLIGDVNPYLTAEEKNKKRWPENGEIVTFTAHVKNHGRKAVQAFEYFWTIDGEIVNTGLSAQIKPNDERIFRLQWRWQSGAHAVSFSADPRDVIPEISQRNNQLTERTDALTFIFHVEETLYN